MQLLMFGQNVRSSELGDLISKALTRIPELNEFNETLCVYCESDDYSINFFVRSEFLGPGFYWTKGDPIDRMPTAIVKVLERADCQHFIWLSRTVLEQDVQTILWNFLHQCAHLLQRRGKRPVESVRTFLDHIHRAERFRDTVTQLEIAPEFDAELFAKTKLVEIFGEQAYQAYRGAEDRDQVRYHERLSYLERKFALFNCGAPDAGQGMQAAF